MVPKVVLGHESGPNEADVAAPASPAAPRPGHRRGCREMRVYGALERFTGRDDHISPNRPEMRKTSKAGKMEKISEKFRNRTG